VTEEFAGINFCWLDYALTTADGTSYNMNQLLDYDSATGEPHFQKPADVSTSSAVPDGYSLTGKVVSYNSANEITYSLYPSDGKGGYSETALEGHDGATLIAAVTVTDNDFTATSNQHTQGFEITGIPAGTYKLVIMKKNHVKFTITDIVIAGSNVDFTAQDMNSRVQTIQMCVGDVDGDGFVTYVDVNKIAGYAQYGVDEVGNHDFDVDGDGVVTYVDVNLVAGVAWYGSSDEDYFAASAKAT
jgi:hypothetical protein